MNNNIVLIDTYNRLREQGSDAISASLETGQLRLRPMVLAVNIDLLNREISFDLRV